ncbi:MAG: APC family permease [Thaumarchaeota archaeon]|nr:APC family permease [Nitrososphaerota archaeon]
MALPSRQLGALVVKLAALVIGIVVTAFATGYLYDELSFLSQQSSFSLGDVIVAVAALSLALTGVSLIASLPQSLRTRFARPRRVQRPRPIYGLGTMLAIGIGATLGSPLFILIPQNIIQYEFVSVGSLILAAVLSVLMAKVYADMYTDMRQKGLEAVGGPSFTRVAVGVRSARYFIARMSMWVANTTLAAYSKIVFLIFDYDYFPKILSGIGIGGFLATLVVYGIAIGLIAWTVLDSLYEQRLLRTTGVLQIFLTGILVAILVYHSALLGSVGSWNFSGILKFTAGGNWVVALAINTGYLYLLFFGFQEIQSLEQDAVPATRITIISWIKKGYTMDKARYLGLAMIMTVIITAAINIFYGLAVYAAHPDPTAVLQAQIPALYLASTFLGPGQELLIGIAFLIASVTTFVPAFLAATRHLAALGDDGYMPQSIARLSWLFTLVSIFLLAVGNENFLVDITDFMVLIGLGIIVLSSVWLRSARGIPISRVDALPIFVGASCFIAGGAVYLLSSSVVVFGTLAILFAYLVFDILELGRLGTQIFLSFFSLACLSLLGISPYVVHTGGTFLSLLPISAAAAQGLLVYLLLVAPLVLLANAYVDARVLSQSRR